MSDKSQEVLLEQIQKQYEEEDPLDLIRQSWQQNHIRKSLCSREKFVNIQISVIDTGVGMSEEGVKKLFIDFNKLDENSQRNKQGTGLGLSICKKMIEQMGGSVSVKS